MPTISERACGILLPIFSLPSKYGIGSLGKQAYRFIDWLEKAGQRYWQVLPVHATTNHNSPYTLRSAMAGNELFVDIDLLIEQSLLKKSDLRGLEFGSNPKRVDYEAIRSSHRKVLEIAAHNFLQNPSLEYKKFCEYSQVWLEDYALYLVIREMCKHAELFDWPQHFRKRNSDVLKRIMSEKQQDFQVNKVIQYFFFKQWEELKGYANYHGVKIVGDMPFYVGPDSVEVWAHPEMFCLDENGRPAEVAGCPPDLFCEEGQLWGNPIYSWDYLEENNYEWWKRRLKHSFELYDVLRIDHFRGFESYYSIPSSSETAQYGYWVEGPGIKFFNNIMDSLNDLPIVAEDLGFITVEVNNLLRETGFPGMKILQFAFDAREKEVAHLPYSYSKNSVAYIGNHDNDTCVGWIKSAPKADVEYAKRYLNVTRTKDLPKQMIYAVMGSRSNTCIISMQDLLGLGSEARINTPSTVDNNWEWRITEKQIRQCSAQELLEMTTLFGRAEHLHYKKSI